METSTIRDVLSKMENAVRLKLFTSADKCIACKDVLLLIQELTTHSLGKIEYENISLDDADGKKKAATYNVSRAPTIIFVDYGIRYTGAPIGLELAPFVQTIIMASTGQTVLGDLANEQLARIKKPVTLEVIVTPTCPYCAQAVLLENSLAIMSENVSVDVVESYENPDIARKYEVTGVPVTIINKEKKITGVPNLASLLSGMQDDKKKLDEIYG